MTLQTCAVENFHSCEWRDEQTVKRAQTLNEDPHQCERKFELNILGKHEFFFLNLNRKVSKQPFSSAIEKAEKLDYLWFLGQFPIINPTE